MKFTHDISRAMEQTIGKDGADHGLFSEVLRRTEGAMASLKTSRDSGQLPVLTLNGQGADIKPIEDAASHIAQSFKTLVVVGMGGSSYGGKAICALAQNSFASTAGTGVYFLDNIDPFTADQLLVSLELKTTTFLLVSKSGDTAETMAHALLLVSAVESRLGKAAVARHFMAITEPKDSALKRLADSYGMRTLDHDPGIGGRFSALSNVGLLPARVMGLDIRAVRQGAADVATLAFATGESEPAKGAALHAALEERGRTLAVLMPYCDRLDPFNTWYRQLWAESLGKGGRGTTPLRSLGACDQHSQLQIYLDGPRDKFISLILLEQSGKGPLMPDMGDATLSYLAGRTLGDLMEAEQRATLETLTRNRCPLRVFGITRLNEEVLGGLMMHFMLETMITGELMGVNTFDQPAVEEGKKLAREYLARR